MSKHPMSADLRHPAMVFGRRFHETCLAAADALDRLHAASEWRPIENAPKDGTRVLLFIPCSDAPAIGSFIRERWCADKEHIDVSCGRWCQGGTPESQRLDPTHWLPLPQPPKGTE